MTESIEENQERTIKGREFSSGTLCELDGDGYWKATSTIIDRVLYSDSEEWVEEKIEGMSIDRSYEAAIRTAMVSCLSYLQENVYDKGLRGLVEFKALERALKDASKT